MKPTARPCEASVAIAAFARRSSSRSVSYAVSAASSSIRTITVGLSTVARCCRVMPASDRARSCIATMASSSSCTECAASAANRVSRSRPMASSMPPLRSMPHTSTRPEWIGSASPSSRPQTKEALPLPEEPATSVCGPSGSRHSAPPSAIPIGTVAPSHGMPSGKLNGCASEST